MPQTIDRSLRLPANQFLPPAAKKTGICIHHTVGGSARSTFDWWLNDGQQVGVAYIIERDGRVYEVFPPEAWAWQFGLKWSSSRKIAFEQRFIGIEIASEGGLKESGGKLYCFDRVSPRCEKNRAEAFDYGRPYRGYRYFDSYERAQVDALIHLMDDLLARFAIPRRRPANPLDFHGEALEHFSGVIGHTMVRDDKSDPIPDEGLWRRLADELGVVGPADAPVAGRPTPAPTPAVSGKSAELAELIRDNQAELSKLAPDASAVVQCLLMELERDVRSTYVRLFGAVPGGYTVKYTFVRGRADLVGRLARALRFARITDSELEVMRV
jgi:N-acetyl-anhydromuramyl-L-alanine amidase AmpD